jgi:hypothetical protein
MAVKRYSLKMQIAEVEREIGKRRGVYGSQVAARAMRQEEADLRIAVMESVLETLRWLAKHEQTIKEIARGSAKPEGA